MESKVQDIIWFPRNWATPKKLEPYPIILVDYTGTQTTRSFSWLNWGHRQEQLLQFLPSIVRIFGSYASWYLILAGGVGWGGFPLGGKATHFSGNPFPTMAIGNPETHPAIEACHGERFHRTKDATMDPQIVLHCGGSKCQWQGNGKRQQEVVDVFWRIDFLNTEIINCWVR